MFFLLMACIKNKKVRYLQTHSAEWSYSSAGSEHLPYKQGVLGSNPSGTTRIHLKRVDSFILREW